MPVEGDKWLKAQDDIQLSSWQSEVERNHMIKVAVDYLNSWQLINKSLQL